MLTQRSAKDVLMLTQRSAKEAKPAREGDIGLAGGKPLRAMPPVTDISKK